MKTDLENREDIEKLVNQFYEKVKKDEVIGYFFTEVEQVDWVKHLPVMYDFWENVLFYTQNFQGNPMVKHLALHQKSSLQPKHFEQWVRLFCETTDELFEGFNAELIKQKASNIANIMQIKICNIAST
jgi:hemoglobin